MTEIILYIYIQSCSLFFQKRACSCGADLVHFKIHYCSMFKPYIFCILSSYFKKCIYRRIKMKSPFCLCRNFIYDSICSNKMTYEITSASCDSHTFYPYGRLKFFSQFKKTLFYCFHRFSRCKEIFFPDNMA